MQPSTTKAELNIQITDALANFSENIRGMSDKKLEFRMLTVLRRTWEFYNNGGSKDSIRAEKAGMDTLYEELLRRKENGKKEEWP
jgi:hypothetical protein